MKIKKLVEAKKLIEAEDEEIELTNVNPQETTIGELKDIVKDEVEEVTGGDQEISDGDALKVATEIKSTSTEVGAGQIVIGAEDYEDSKVENKLTEALDEAYATAKKAFRRGKRGTGTNILVEGLPGSGKTAIVEAWCNSRGVTLVPVNATDPKLETSINGMPLRDVTAPEENKVARVRDDVLDKLLNNVHPELAGKCVLFVDEFNRQKQDQLRRPLMSLFNEKRNSDGSVDVSKNLLFSVICINPSGIKFKDKGTVDVNDPEHNRFLHTLRGYDSNKDEALKFYKG
jgi:MoxR-like ATPase